MSFNFNGQVLITPATATYVDSSAMDKTNSLSTAGILALVGECDTFVAANPVKIDNYQVALALLGDTEPTILKAIAKAFDPSPDTDGARYIVFVKANDEEIATATFKDVTALTPLNAMRVDAKTPGKGGAGITVAITNGATGTKNVTVKKPGFTALGKNLQRKLFTVQYVGSGSAATMAIDDVQVTIIISAPTSKTHIFTFADYQSMDALVSAINSINDVNATLSRKTGAERVRPTSGQIDVIDEASILAITVTAKGDTQAVIDWLNSKAGGNLVVATRLPGALKTIDKTADAKGVKLDYTPQVAATTAQWQAAFDALKVVDVQWLVPMSYDPTVHDLCAAHCDYMSSIGNKRRAVIGLNPTLTEDFVLSSAFDMDNERVSMVHQGIYDKNLLGQKALFPSTVTAALIAGMMCGVPPATALTNKRIKAIGMQKRLLIPDDTDIFLDGGVLVCARNISGTIKVMQSLTTAQTDNYNEREMSVGVATDTVETAIRDVLDPLRGQKNTPYLLLAEVLSRAESRLKQLAIPEPEGEGILVGDADNPPYIGLHATHEADSIRLEFQCSPVIPCNYIGVVIHTVPYSGASLSI